MIKQDNGTLLLPSNGELINGIDKGRESIFTMALASDYYSWGNYRASYPHAKSVQTHV